MAKFLVEADANNVRSKLPLDSIKNWNSALQSKLRPERDLVLFLAYNESTATLMVTHEPHKLQPTIDGTSRQRWQPEVVERCQLPKA